ncbi:MULTISPECIES: SDR family oxidoreductase [Symbiopectobacterium]|uniref:SDR family oxidoreductase n=1 Tax=Symbiopectobacterium TaxID=801 RepID=UPI00207A221E|nr:MULTISPECIES: SDR family oxidoreductase [Symbiopectobacterium]
MALQALDSLWLSDWSRAAIDGRSAQKRATALRSLGERASAYAVDITDRASLAAFFAQTTSLAGLFTPAASYTTGAFQEGSLETSEALFQAKFWGQYWAVYAALPSLLPDAAVVFMSGAAYAACNAALDGLARGLAVELTPRRINCLSPGTTDSTLWQQRPAQVRKAAYQQWCKLNVLQRPATVEEQADTALFLIDNTHMTGNTLYCDGGYTLR